MAADLNHFEQLYKDFGFDYLVCSINPGDRNKLISDSCNQYAAEIGAKKAIVDKKSGLVYCFRENGKFIDRFHPSELETPAKISQRLEQVASQLFPHRDPSQPRNLLAGAPVTVHFQCRTDGIPVIHHPKINLRLP